MSIGWILKGILFISAIIAIIISLLQSRQNDNAAQALSGQSNLFSNHKESGQEKVVTIIMYIAIIVFFSCVLALSFI